MAFEPRSTRAAESVVAADDVRALIGEYARHNGHADLLREAIDGVTGR